ncbi:MAG: WXG100 family type VII secretion target [Chloroflexi bacterium]|nr:WXG100 family type VII secretion target [Chloroflexota bacterium]
MSRVIADPAALRQFARQLTRYVTLLRQESDTLDRQFAALGAAWRDDEHRRFAGEYVTMARQVRHFCEQAEQHAPLLERKAARLDAYFGGGASAGVAGGASAGVAGGASAGAAGGASAGAAGGAPGSPPQMDGELRLYDPHAASRRGIFSQVQQQMSLSDDGRQKLRQATEARATWIEVDRLPVPDASIDHTLKRTSEELSVTHLIQLAQTVEPWIRDGATREDFAALDAQLGRDSMDQTGYARTYDMFFGNDPITVGIGASAASQPTAIAVGSGSINAGTHLVVLARKLGIHRLPVRVLGNKP